jgi:hypothetical protein
MVRDRAEDIVADSRGLGFAGEGWVFEQWV